MSTVQKTKLINVRVSEEEKKLLEIGARQMHLSLSAFIIQTALNEVEAVMNIAIKKKYEINDTLGHDELHDDEKFRAIAKATGINAETLKNISNYNTDAAIKDFLTWSENNAKNLEIEFGPIPRDDIDFSTYMQKVKASSRWNNRRKSV